MLYFLRKGAPVITLSLSKPLDLLANAHLHEWYLNLLFYCV